jgi:hypothetical protein
MRGEHIKVWRGWYWHHGIDMGDGTIIHASGEPGRRVLAAEVRRSAMEEFLRGGVAVAVASAAALAPEEVAARAESSLGRRGYSLVWNNCEHFAHWCHSGRSASAQVDRAAWAGAALGATLSAGVALARRSGRAAGLLRMLPLAGPLSASAALIAASIAVASRLRTRSG